MKTIRKPEFWIAFLITSLATMVIWALTNYPNKNDYPPNKITSTWAEDSVQIKYKNGDIDTVFLYVSDVDNYTLKLEDGNLSYWRLINPPNSGKVYLASYVQSYKILSSKLKSITQ